MQNDVLGMMTWLCPTEYDYGLRLNGRGWIYLCVGLVVPGRHVIAILRSSTALLYIRDYLECKIKAYSRLVS